MAASGSEPARYGLCRAAELNLQPAPGLSRLALVAALSACAGAACAVAWTGSVAPSERWAASTSRVVTPVRPMAHNSAQRTDVQTSSSFSAVRQPQEPVHDRSVPYVPGWARTLRLGDALLLSLCAAAAGLLVAARRLLRPGVEPAPLGAALAGHVYALQGPPRGFGAGGPGMPGGFGAGAPGRFGVPQVPTPGGPADRFRPPQPPDPVPRKPGGLIIPDVKDVEKYAGAASPAGRPDSGPGVPTPMGGMPGSSLLPPPEKTDSYEGATYMPPPKEGVEGLSEADMFAVVRSRAKPWFELSRYIQALMRLGASPNKIYDQTGISPLEQSLWHVQSFVYESLVASPAYPRDKLAYFSNPQLTVLSELRELMEEERPEAAEYCVDRRLTATEARELARSYKLVKLFSKEAQGFTDHPGDCLAFKYWRMGIEFQKSDPEAFKDACQRGLKYVHSDSARARLEALAEGKLQGTLDALAAQQAILKSMKASLPVVRLGSPDSHWRCLPVLGPLEAITEAMLQTAPFAAPTGVFKTFRPTSTYSWMTVPNWPELQGVAQPCLLEVTDPRAVPDCEALAGVGGPCMLLVSIGSA
eukprot:EG_transcript_7336